MRKTAPALAAGALLAIAGVLVATRATEPRAAPATAAAGDAACTTTASPGTNLTTFEASLAPGAVGCLRGGVYPGGWRFTRSGTATSPITIASSPGETAVLEAPYAGTCRNVLQIANVAFLRVQGLLIRNGNAGAPLTACDNYTNVYLSGTTNHVTVAGNEITGAHDHGLFCDPGSSANEIVRNRVHHNGSPGAANNADHAIYCEGAGNLIASNVVYDHHNGHAVQIYPSANGTIIAGNTIVASDCTAPCNNTASHLTAGIIVGSETACGARNVQVVNNIVYGGQRGIYGYRTCTDGSNKASSNVVFGNTTCNLCNDATAIVYSANVVADPLFTDYPTRALTVVAGSPAVDTANPAFVYSPDLVGAARPQGLAADIGAYEFTVAPPPAPTDTVTVPTVPTEC